MKIIKQGESVLWPVLELMEHAYKYFTPECTTPGHVTYTQRNAGVILVDECVLSGFACWSRQCM